jgi:large subunit ribosomal protein L23
MIKPIITEKSLAMAQKGWYTFAVKTSERKQDIAQKVKQTFHVDVVCVRSIRMHGKIRRAGRLLRAVHRPDWKKAMVQLKTGQKIDVFEVTQQTQST